MIYFQKQKYGGGEVDDVFITEDGTAVIVFDKPEVAQRVMKLHHSLGGTELELKSYCPDQEKTQQVFSNAVARVNFGMFQLSSRETHNLLEKVKDKAGITWREHADAFILNGTFDQVQNAHRYLQEYFARRPYLQLTPEVDSIKDIRNTKQDAGWFSSQASNVAKVTDIYKVVVQPTVMKVLKQVYKTTLQDMEKEFCLEIVWGEDEQEVTIRPKENTQESLYLDGCDAFTSLYQKVHQDLKREVLEIEDNVHDEEGIQNAIQLVEGQNPVVIEKLKNKLFVYAEENVMESTVKALNKQLALLQTSKQTAARGQRSFNHDACSMNEQHQRDQPSLPNILEHTLSNGVNLSLRQGDITEEKVDAIVNPTNSLLRHGEAGLAAAIVHKGGRQILDDSWSVMSHRNGPLQVSEAFYTRSGNLPCQYVIHTVVPDWSINGKEASSLLIRRACLESLRLAVRLKLSSIALPAISSDSFGMPEDICAQAIFKAVDEFSSSIDAECSNLRDIRIVINDGPGIAVFRKEFENRYFSNVTHSPIDQKEECTSSTTSTGHPQSAKEILDNQGKSVDKKSPSAEVHKSEDDNASNAGETETQTSTSYTPIVGSTLERTTADNFNQVPLEKGTNQTDPDSSTTEASTTEDALKFSDTSQSSDQSLQSHCLICQSVLGDSVYPAECGHTCKRCADEAVENGTSTFLCNQKWCQRNQPVGHMSWITEKQSLPGHEDCETIAITYNFLAGQQGWEHPTPGVPFTAYLPNNAEGQAVCEMLKREFEAGLLFTIGKSQSTGKDTQILWNSVELKTNRSGGPSDYGYPDPEYLGRVRAQLASKEIKDDTSPAQTKE